MLAFGTLSIVLLALLCVLALQRARHSALPATLRSLPERLRGGSAHPLTDYDPGRELRAEQRARELLRSCVNEEEWAMYRELGFMRVWGTSRERTTSRLRGASEDDGPPGRRAGSPQCAHAYLIYPHKPILAYVPEGGRIVGEYCVEFPDQTRPYGSPRLPDSDDVLAKWIRLTADEQGLIEHANMHLPGRQIRIVKARRDLARLAAWEREREATPRRAPRRVGSVPAL
ncbi:MAG: hypothetical protein WB998_02940 [Solirubrobacteraceae bacterium]